MRSVVTACVPLLVEYGDRRIETTRLPRAAFAFREGLGGTPAAPCAWAHVHLPRDHHQRQPLLPEAAGLLVLAKAWAPMGLPRCVRPAPRRGIRINGGVGRRARMGKRVYRNRLRWCGGRVPRQRRSLAEFGFDGFAEMLHEMPAIRDLHGLR